MYKIKYSNNSYFPDYPDNLKYARSSDWPPVIGSEINITNPNNATGSTANSALEKKYNGIVKKYIWNETAAIIKIDDNDFIEQSLKFNPKWNYGKGYFIYFPIMYGHYQIKNYLKIIQIIITT